MKTILCNEHLKTFILRALALKQDTSVLQDIRTLTPEQYLQIRREDRQVMTLRLAHVLDQDAEQFPVYGKMFRYPAFLQEILAFAEECVNCGIRAEDLPSDNASEAELKKILSGVLTTEKTETQALTERKEDEDILMYPMFIQDVHLYRAMVRLDAETVSFPETVQESVRLALNTRQELEAAAQDICLRGKPCNVILTSAEQLPVLHAVFRRYGIPYACINRKITVHILNICASLIRLAVLQDTSSYLDAVIQKAFGPECDASALRYAAERITDITQPVSVSEKLKETDYEKYIPAFEEPENLYNAFLAEIHADLISLLGQTDCAGILQEAFRILQKSPYLNDPAELSAARKLRSRLISCAPEIRTKEDLLMLAEMIAQSEASYTDDSVDFCTVTDLTHPVLPKEVSYVIGCSGRNYPGFRSRSGLFDEAYVRKIEKYPALEERYDLYHSQLEWIRHSASGIIWSCPTNDYTGREIHLSFDIENRLKETIQKWDLIEHKEKRNIRHVLSADTARELFSRKGTASGSVSSIERYFSCPYSYFIQRGLKVRIDEIPAMDARSLGDIQHAFMEHHFKDGLTADDIPAFTAPYLKNLTEVNPAQEALIRMCGMRLERSLRNALLILEEIEKSTCFAQKEAEYRFDTEIIKGLSLHGIIDRVDAYHDYFRILDYKSSEKKLSEKDIKAGLKLQLLTYLIIYSEMNRAVPSGAYYYSLKETAVDEKPYHLSAGKRSAPEKELTELFHTPEGDLADMLKERRLTGWTMTESPDDENETITGYKTKYDFEKIRTCILEVYAYFLEHLLDGDIPLEPAQNACMYCDYYPVCRFQGEQVRKEPVVMKDISLKADKEDRK